jgi:hypothetical protein
MRAGLIGLVMAWSLTAACGGDSGSGVPGNTPLGQLTADDVVRLCDWGASLYGGYGRSKSCSDGNTAHSDSSRDACVASASTFPASCIATVADLEGCARAIHDVCEAQALNRPDCQALLTCSTAN